MKRAARRGPAQRGGAATRDVPRPSWPCSGTGGTPVAQEGTGSVPLPRGRGQDAHATAGGTPTLHPTAVHSILLRGGRLQLFCRAQAATNFLDS
jgi:hypothetical protein